MSSYLEELFIHDNINIYGGDLLNSKGQSAIADSHWSNGDTLPGNARIHITQTASYATIHWVIRHEAAHLRYGDTSQTFADSVANACGPDTLSENLVRSREGGVALW